MSKVRFPEAFVQLSGADGNAGALMGLTSSALRAAGATGAEVTEFRAEAMSGNYDELIQTIMRWVEIG